MEKIKSALAKIGGYIWRLAQTTNYLTLGAAAIIGIVIFVSLVWLAL
jgi:hypothetical protein